MFASLFVFHPDLLVSSFAHSVLNFSAVYLGFFSFTDESSRPLPTTYC